MRQSYSMRLPGAGDGEGAALEIVLSAVNGEAKRAARQVGKLDAFVSVPLETPGLRTAGIPEPNGPHLAEGIAGKGNARIVLAGERTHFELVVFDREAKRLTGVCEVDAS